jgi:hypothetical protein
MATYAVRFEGPGVLALDVVTRLADADGVDLVASATPEPVGDGAVTLDVTVEGSDAAVFAAVGSIDAALPTGATVAVST